MSDKLVIKCAHGHRAEAGEAAYAELQAENERLRDWKAETTEVLKGWDQLWDEAGHPGPLGGLKSENVKQALIAECALADKLAVACGDLSALLGAAMNAPVPTHPAVEDYNEARK